MKYEEISGKFFNRRFRGYDPQEVSAFLERIAEYSAGLQREIEVLRDNLATAHQELAKAHDRDRSLDAALTQTQEMAHEIKANAEKEAELLVAEAELQAEKILGQAHNRLAQIHDDIAELKRQRAQFEVRLRSLVEAHLKLLDMELDRDRELSDLEDKIKILRSPST